MIFSQTGFVLKNLKLNDYIKKLKLINNKNSTNLVFFHYRPD